MGRGLNSKPRPDLRVRNALQRAGKATTGEIAQLAGVHPRQARHWLDCMHEAGEVARVKRPRHGRGQPGWMWITL